MQPLQKLQPASRPGPQHHAGRLDPNPVPGAAVCGSAASSPAGRTLHRRALSLSTPHEFREPFGLRISRNCRLQSVETQAPPAAVRSRNHILYKLFVTLCGQFLSQEAAKTASISAERRSRRRANSEQGCSMASLPGCCEYRT